MKLENSIDEAVQERVNKWLSDEYDAETKQTIKKLMQTNPQALVDAFYTNLSFGTGGLRGIMGVGTNRMNVYTVRAATQGLANYLRKVFGESDISVAIGHDSRNNSRAFAENAACVLAGNGIRVYLFEALRPTPLVSFACRYKKCQAAIMITASHNPPEYNGYKVYWDDGAQLLPPHDKGMIDEVSRIRELTQVKLAPLTSPLIEPIGKEVDEAYLQAIRPLALYPEDDLKHGKELKILYSNLHGTGITIVPKALDTFGFTNLGFVEEQKEPDGNFPTAHSPNPEERAALQLGIDKLLRDKYDILLATDPDCDRIGIVVRHRGQAVALTGNEIAAIFTEVICTALKATSRWPAKPAFVKTIVTTDLVKAIAEDEGATVFDVLPGFKYIAEKIRLWEGMGEGEPNGYQYIFGGEESSGYLYGTQVRDKDAAISSCLASEIALHAKLQGKTLVDLLHDIYEKYGVFTEELISIQFDEGKAGKEAQKSMMDRLRGSPPTLLAGHKVVNTIDVKNGTSELPPSNVLIFVLDDSSKVIIRPSGTEPKMKIYLLMKEPITSNLTAAKAHAALKMESLKTAINKLF